LRANEKELGENLKQEIENNMKKNGIKVKFFDEMLGYFPENNNELAEKCARIYKEVFGKEIKKIKVQACLECGFFAEKIKDLEYISIAPNIYNAHSPDEKFSISSADRMWKYILSILQEI
jgi:dipeptidase D